MKTFGELVYESPWFVLKPEPHVALRAKRIFPKIRTSDMGSLRLSHTAENARELEWFLERFPLTMSPEAREVIRVRSASHREHEALLDDLIAGKREPCAFELAIPAREYQRVAADLVMQVGGLLCADDMGVGKSVVGICVVSKPEARPALVVCMTHLPRQWQEEIARFAPALKTHIVKKGTPYDLRIGAGGRRKRGQMALAPELEPELPDVIICPYSKLAGWAETLAPIVKSVVYDELQELRHPDTAKYAAAQHISEAAQVRLGLTATPIHNYGNEMFHVMEILRPGALGTSEEFLREWCSEKMVRDPAALGTHLRTAGLMLRRTRADVGRELPPLQKVPHYLEDVDTAPLAEVESAATELARIILATGSTFEARGQAARDLDWRLRMATGIAKAPQAAEFVRMLVETGEKVVLYGWHREVYSIWMERLANFRPALYTGTESQNQKAESRRRFMAGETPILIMSLRSGAGLDGLQRVCRTAVYGELDWSPQVHDQSTGRIYRDGQPDPVVAYYLLSREGSDPVIADVLGVKAAQAAGIRDPNAPLIEKLQGDGQHARKLAEAYLAKKKHADLPMFDVSLSIS